MRADQCLAPVSVQARRAPFRAPRGGREAAAAETYEAYDFALAAGADYLELDARQTSDGTLVASHRARAAPGLAELGPAGRAGRAVGRTGASRTGSGRAGAGRWRGSNTGSSCQLAGYEVPRLAQVLPLLTGRAGLHLDVKDPGSAARGGRTGGWRASGLLARRRGDNPRRRPLARTLGAPSSRPSRSDSRSAATWPNRRGLPPAARSGRAGRGWTRSSRPARPGRRCTTGRPRRAWPHSAASAASGRWSGPSTPTAR